MTVPMILLFGTMLLGSVVKMHLFKVMSLHCSTAVIGCEHMDTLKRGTLQKNQGSFVDSQINGIN